MVGNRQQHQERFPSQDRAPIGTLDPDALSMTGAGTRTPGGARQGREIAWDDPAVPFCRWIDL
jgi:hypothetical protein